VLRAAERTVKKCIIIFLVLVALLFLAAGYRFVQVLPYPMGGGQYNHDTSA
jgi:hypothetical protein